MADLGVRPAGQGDVGAIAQVQLATWQTAYAAILPPDALASLDPAVIEAGWRDALATPRPGARVLVAVAASDVVGVAAFAPATDDDLDEERWAETGPLLVAPDAQRSGHGSRLLAAAADLMREHGYDYAVTWVPAADNAAQRFLESAGWAPDGASRTLDVAGRPVREVRLETALR